MPVERLTGSVDTPNGRLTAVLNLARASVLRPPWSIVGDGSVEVAAALNAWLADDQAVPPGSTVDCNGLTFWCDTAVKQVNKPLTYLGHGAKLIRKTLGPRPRPASWLQPHLWVHPSSQIYGWSVIGTNTQADSGGKPGFPSYLDDYAFEAAFRCDNPDGFRLTYELVDAVWGDTWQLGGRNAGEFDIGGEPGSRCITDRCGRQGGTPSGHGSAHDLDVLHGRRSGIDLEPDPANPRCSNIALRRMTLTTIGIPIASAGKGDVNDILLEDITERSTSMPVIYAKASDGVGRRDRWTVRRWNGSPSNTSAGTPAVRAVNGRDWLVEDSTGLGATGVAGAVKGIEFVGCGGHNIVRGTDLRPKGKIAADPALQDPDFVLELGRGGVDDNRYV